MTLRTGVRIGGRLVGSSLLPQWEKAAREHTCGARCADFPACISISLDVVAQLVQADEQTMIAERETANRMEALTMIHSAIVDGLSLQERRLRADPSRAGMPDGPLA